MKTKVEILLTNMTLIHKDKLLHSFYGTLLYIISNIFFNIFISFLIVLLISISKEIYDYFNKDRHTPDIKDILFTILIPALFTTVFYFK